MASSAATITSIATITLITMIHSTYGKGLTTTNMVFYMYDIVSGSNNTAIGVAGLKGNRSSPSKFGTVTVIDDVLREGPSPSSKQIGRAQGIYANSAMDDSSLHLLVSTIFTSGKYNGSTLEIQGADSIIKKQREVSIVSGTGKFRFAKGYIVIETITFNTATSNAVIKLSATIRHRKIQV